MATMRAGLRAQGLGPAAIDLVLRSRRQSTNRLYDLRWTTWFNYCEEHGIDPTHPSVSQFADFLTYLHSVKELTAITIAGYRTVISTTVAITRGVNHPSFASSVVITQLINGFKHAAPLRRSLCPKWDVTVVLTFLRERCEPLHSLTIKVLTYKTVFLLALATARRVSGLHAISGLPDDVVFARHNSSVTLAFLPEFRAKNQSVTELSQPFTIPGLRPLLCSDDTDIALCPVRCLKAYLARTKASRHGKRRLLVSINQKYPRDIQKGSVSRWLRALIRLAYDESSASLPPCPIRAHETRAISSSLAVATGAPLTSVLRAGYWKRQTTFLNFYLRDLAVHRLDNSSAIGPAVFAGHVA